MLVSFPQPGRRQLFAGEMPVQKQDSGNELVQRTDRRYVTALPSQVIVSADLNENFLAQRTDRYRTGYDYRSR